MQKIDATTVTKKNTAMDSTQTQKENKTYRKSRRNEVDCAI